MPTYLGTKVISGTDDTAAIAAWAAALGSQTKKGEALVNAVGPHDENFMANARQVTGRMPDGQHCLVATAPNFPDGVFLEGNNAEIDVTAASGHGPFFIVPSYNGGYYFNGASATATTFNGYPARSGDRVQNLRVVYAGPVGGSTGIGMRVDGVDEFIENVHVYGFKTGIQIDAAEYSYFAFNGASFNGTGFKITSGCMSLGPCTAAQAGGSISIDNTFVGNLAHSNGIGLWANGAAGNRFYGGSVTFNTVADINVGANPPNYISTIALGRTSAAVCTANATIPLTFADATGAGSAAEGVLITDARGKPTAAWSTNGGMHYSLAAGKVTASVPKSATLGCATPPAMTVTVASTAGMGDYDGAAPGGNGLNTFAGMDIESDRVAGNGMPMGRPATGFDVLLDSVAGGNLFDGIQYGVGGGPQEFVRMARDLGGNIFKNVQFAAITDPANPSVHCAAEFGNTARGEAYLGSGPGFDPMTWGCFAVGRTANTPMGPGSYLAVTGWDAGSPFTHYNAAVKAGGFTASAGSPAAAPFAPLFTVGVQGEKNSRGGWFANGSLQVGPGDGSGYDTSLGRGSANNWTTNGGGFTAGSLSTGQKDASGTTCTIGGYITLTVDGTARKLAYCK